MDFGGVKNSSYLFVNKELPKPGKQNQFSGDGRNSYFQSSETAFVPPRLGREEFRFKGIQPMETSQQNTPDEDRNASFLIATGSKGIVISSNGKHHRGWWPCLVDSVHSLPIDIGDEQATSMDRLDLPLTISELYRQSGQESKQWYASPSFLGSKSVNLGKLQEIHKGWRSSKKRGYVADERSYHPLHTHGLDYTAAIRQREEKQALWEPFEYAAAKKPVEFGTTLCFRQLYKERVMPSLYKGQAYRRGIGDACFRSGETAFDPFRRLNEEIRPDGIQPAKRRQIFCKLGNRAGIFK